MNNKRLFYLIAITIICFFAAKQPILKAAEAQIAPGLIYSISVCPASLKVAIEVPECKDDKVTFTISDWGSVYDFGKNIYHPEAKTINGHPLEVKRPYLNRWVVANNGSGFRFEYIVTGSKTSFTGSEESDIYHPAFLSDLVFLWGYSYFLLPIDGELRNNPFKVMLVNNTKDAVFSTFPNNRVFRNYDDVKTSFIASGKLRKKTFEVQKAKMKALIQGNKWNFSDDEFLSVLRKIFGYQSEKMGFYPNPSMTIALMEGDTNSTGGTVVKNGIGLYPDPKIELKNNFSLLELIAHENFHLWNAAYLFPEPGKEEGYYKWFQEGFTVYYSLKTLLETGLIDEAKYKFSLNQIFAEYYSNPYAFSATADDLAANYWNDESYTNLPYKKGAMVAFIIDKVIQKVSNNKMDVSYVFKALFKNPRIVKNGYNANDLKKAIVSLSNPTFVRFIDQYAIGASEIPFEKYMKELGCKTETKEIKVFSLGFQIDKPELVKGAKITGFEKNSPAQQAGLAEGDVIEEFGFYDGDPEEKAEIKIKRGKEEILFDFYPARTIKSVELK